MRGSFLPLGNRRAARSQGPDGTRFGLLDFGSLAS
jgi:hypothetical protein